MIFESYKYSKEDYAQENSMPEVSRFEGMVVYPLFLFFDGYCCYY